MNQTGACLHCGEPLKLVPILYGYPAPEAFEAEDRGQLVIAGCIVGDDDPKYACSACHEPMRSPLDADRPRFRRIVPLEEASSSLQADLELRIVEEGAGKWTG